MSDQPGGGTPPPPGQPPQAPQPQAPQAPPPQAPTPAQAPPPQNWQSTPQQPGPPPAAGGQPSGAPAWTNNITARETMAGPGGVALASMPERIIGYIIDAIIIGLIGFVINFILGSFLTETRTDFVFGIPVVVRGPSMIANVLGVLISVAISAGYFIYMWTRMGGSTIGMRLFKLSVRDEATGGQISQQQAINRWMAIGLPGALSLAYVLPLIGFIVAIGVLVYYIYLLVSTAQSPTRQGFHDKFAKTVVAKLSA